MNDTTNTSQIRTFTLAETVTGWLDGELKDWPASIQDPIFLALERKAQKEQLPLAIVYSECKIDHDVAEGVLGRFFVHVVASEIVMADERTLAPGTVLRTLPQELEYMRRDTRFRH